MASQHPLDASAEDMHRALATSTASAATDKVNDQKVTDQVTDQKVNDQVVNDQVVKTDLGINPFDVHEIYTVMGNQAIDSGSDQCTYQHLNWRTNII